MSAASSATGSMEMRPSGSNAAVTGGGGGGYHRSRDRTRRSAVLRLLERRQAEKEKERERDRSARARSDSTGRLSTMARNLRQAEAGAWTAAAAAGKQQQQQHATRSSSSHVFSAAATRGQSEKTRSYSASEDVIEEEEIVFTANRTSSRSAERLFAGADVTTKTYISIGPGKPTRIRENSPSKSPTRAYKRETTDNGHSLNGNNVSNPGSASPYEELRRVRSSAAILPNNNNSRDQSPSKKSEALFGDSSPLKSTSLFKDIPVKNGRKVSATKVTTTTTFNSNATGAPSRKRSFTTEKTIIIGNNDVSAGEQQQHDDKGPEGS